MNEMEKLQYVLFERLHRRAPGIDKLDRLWDAAVLLPLVRTPEGISVLFEERAHTLRSQPGEICFPGGKYECADNSFRNTAVRETCEELGLQPENITICGELDCLVTHNGPIIHPFVGLIDDISKITYSKSEVERIFTVPLKVLLEQKPRRGFLAKAMDNVKMIDSKGYGIHNMFVRQKERYLPMPNYDESDDSHVRTWKNTLEKKNTVLIRQTQVMKSVLSEVLPGRVWVVIH